MASAVSGAIAENVLLATGGGSSGGGSSGGGQQHLVLPSIVLVLAVTCVWFHVKKFSFWSSRNMPGPRPWPVFGTNIYYLLYDKIALEIRWREQFGKTYGLYDGYSPLLRTTDNELIKQIYIKRFSSFTDHYNDFVNGPVQRNWLLWSEGERWSNQRALVTPMFSSARMRHMLGAMSACVDRFLGHVRDKQLTNGDASSSPAKLQKRDLSNMTLDVIATTFFGLKLNTYLPDNLPGDEFLRVAYNFSRLHVGRFLAWILMPRQVARALTFDLFPDKNTQYFDLLTKRIIQERRGGSQANGAKQLGAHGGPSTRTAHNDFVQLFLEAELPESYQKVFSVEDDCESHYNDQTDHEQLERTQRQQTSQAKLFKRFSDLEIRGQMTFLFLAGFETTSTTLTFCLLELAHQGPGLQERLHEELTSAFGPEHLRELSLPARASPTTTATRALPEDLYTKLQSLQLLEAFVSEILRLYSPILEVNRRSSEPVELTLTVGTTGTNGNLGREQTMRLPKGLPVSVNPFVLHRDPELFEEAHEFQLERFLPERRAKLKSCSFMPFGLGPRHCVGMRFALLEIKLALAKILAGYTVAFGPAARAHPPKLQRNPVFLVPDYSDFELRPRAA